MIAFFLPLAHFFYTYPMYKLNTGNPGKKKEFLALFQAQGAELTFTNQSVKEIVSSPIEVVVHKASQLPEGVIVDDTSLDVEGAAVGIDVRWLLEELPKYCGKKALWRVLLAHRKADGKIYVYQGETRGEIVEARAKGKEGFGFDPIFLPEGCKKTLAEEKPEAISARAKAIKALLDDRPIAIKSPIMTWTGQFQRG